MIAIFRSRTVRSSSLPVALPVTWAMAAPIALAASLAVGCASTTAPQPVPTAGPPSTESEPSPTEEPAPPPEPEGPGLSKATAVEVCEPQGEREYLSRLRCADGNPPAFERLGSVGSRNPTETPEAEELATEQVIRGRPVGPDEIDYHVIDLYEVVCAEGRYSVFLDMYHCDQPPPTVAPPGLTFHHPGPKI